MRAALPFFCISQRCPQTASSPAARRLASSRLNCGSKSTALVASATAAAGVIVPSGPAGPVAPSIYAQHRKPRNYADCSYLKDN